MSEVDLIQIRESVHRLIELIGPRLCAIEARQAALERAIESQTAAILAALAAIHRG